MSESFCTVLRELIDGRRPVLHAHNEFVGHADVVRQLLDVAPASIRADFTFLHDLLAAARDATGAAVLGVFPRLTDPELANVEGRIADFIGDACGIRLGGGRYLAGHLVGESRCSGWPGIGSPLTNNRFPYLLDTSASNYFSNRFWHGDGAPPGFIPVPENGRVVFRGEYPRARYFAFHPSDFDTNTLATLVDVDLDPDEGSANPFRGPVPVSAGRRFTAQLVFAPPPPKAERNTTYVGSKRDGHPNPAVFNILRTSGSELGALPPNSAGVSLPSVTVYDAAGAQTLHYPECEPYPPGVEPPVESTHFAPLPIPDHRGLVRPGVFDVKSNWGLPYDLLASDDISYLNVPFTRRLGEIFVVRAKAFSTPRTPAQPVYTPGLQIRGFTVATYNLWAGIANSSRIDEQLALDDEGWFTLLVSSADDCPANATAENGVTWMDWGPYLDGQLTFRFLLRRDPLLVLLREAIETGVAAPEVAAHVPRAAHGARAQFEAKGWRGVFAA